MVDGIKKSRLLNKCSVALVDISVDREVYRASNSCLGEFHVGQCSGRSVRDTTVEC